MNEDSAGRGDFAEQLLLFFKKNFQV